MDLQKIAVELSTAKNLNELKQVDELLRSRWRILRMTGVQASMEKQSFVPGQIVKFRGRRRQGVLVGKIEKFNRTSIAVKVPGAFGEVTWRVSPDILKPATQEEYDRIYKVMKGQQERDAKLRRPPPQEGQPGYDEWIANVARKTREE